MNHDLGQVTITKIRSDKNHVVFNKSRHRLESRYVTGQLTIGHWTWYCLTNEVLLVNEPWDETGHWDTWQGCMHLSRRSWVRNPRLYFYFVLRLEDRLLCTSELMMPRYIVEYLRFFWAVIKIMLCSTAVIVGSYVSYNLWIMIGQSHNQQNTK